MEDSNRGSYMRRKPRARHFFLNFSHKRNAVSCQARHVAANVSSFAATFLFLEGMSPLAISVAAPFRKRSRSAFLFGCKHPHDEKLSLPTFCGQIRSHHSIFILSEKENAA